MDVEVEVDEAQVERVLLTKDLVVQQVLFQVLTYLVVEVELPQEEAHKKKVMMELQ